MNHNNNNPLSKQEASSCESLDCDMESLTECKEPIETIQGPVQLLPSGDPQVLVHHDPTTNKEMTSNDIFSLLNILRSAIAEVVAFPTQDNFQRLLKHSKAAHDAYVQFGHTVELGKNHLETNDDIFVDSDTRSKLNTIGTTLWNLIGKHPECFIDATSHDDWKDITCSDHSEPSDLVMCRTIASGYIRSIAGRMILIDKLHSRNPPRLVSSNSSSFDDSLPLALASELEFGLSVFSRAGRALSQCQNVNHSSQNTVVRTRLDSIRASYDSLVLALECWTALCRAHGHHHSDNPNDSHVGIGDQIQQQAFEVMLLLPNVASEVVFSKTMDVCQSNSQEQKQQNINYHPILHHLRQLNDFVSKQLRVVENKDWECILYAFQRFLPPLAKICYKHGNRLARNQEYESAKEALHISLKAAEMLKNHIMFAIDAISKKGSSNASNVTPSSLEINKSEMMVISKQVYYVLSNVLHSQGMFTEANEYLDHIELFVDEMCRREEELYSKTMDELTSNETNHIGTMHTGFALEAPRRQDVAQIRARADAARTRAKAREAKERIFLSYHRIKFLQKEHESSSSTLSSHEYETSIDKHFQQMIEWVKYLPRDSNDPRLSEVEEINSMNVQNSYDLILSIARSVTSKRLLVIDAERVSCVDLYAALVSSVPDESAEQLQFCLEAMDTCLLAAANVRNAPKSLEANISTLSKALDHRVNVMGYDLITRLRSFVSSCSIANTGNNLAATKSKVLSTKESTIDTLLEKARNYCAKALSLYQSHEDYEQTTQWCDIFLKVNEVWRSNNTSKVEESTPDGDWDNIVAGVIAVKAIAQSSGGDHGSGLKTAREAWSKNGAQLCNFLALFICAFKYESSSVVNFDEGSNHRALMFENTILELDNAFTTFSSLSRFENDKVTVESIFDTFQTMCHLANGHLMLEIAIQMRWLRFSVKSIHSNWSNLCYEINRNRVTMFSILQPYLCNLENLIESRTNDFDFESIFIKFTELKTSLDEVLNLLLYIRNANSASKRKHKRKNDDDMALDDDFSFELEESKTEKVEAVSLFEDDILKRVIGNERQCLWVGEQLWNIGNHMLKFDVPGNHHASKWGLLAAYLFRCSHDFAFLSEEEQFQSLTQGNLACERFRNGSSVNYTEISLPCKTQSSDLCSEFSYQALLLSAISVAEALNQQTSCGKQRHNASLEISHEIQLSIQCLNAALAELYTVGLDCNMILQGAPSDTIVWVYLNLLILQNDDVECSKALDRGGLLDVLREQMHSATSSQGIDAKEVLERLLQFASQAEATSMIVSARILYSSSLELMKDIDIVSHELVGGYKAISVGSLYRKLIGMSRSVHEIVSVFDTIDRTMTHCMETKKSEDDATQTSSVPFSVQDVDFFIVEAHNRAITLIGIGDAKSSEKLLVVAMNLLTHCSKEVESYGSDIRRTYRNVLSKIGIGGFALSF